MVNSILTLVFVSVVSFCILSLLLPSSQAFRLSRQEDEDDEVPKPDSKGRYHIGDFTSYDHGLTGSVLLVDEKTVQITGLNYDGEGPATWFMVGRTERSPLPEFLDLKGTVIPDENESCSTLQPYDGDDIVLKLPGDMKFSDYNYLSMYCIRFAQNFGYVSIPDNIKLKNGTSNIGECNQAEAQDSIL